MHEDVWRRRTQHFGDEARWKLSDRNWVRFAKRPEHWKPEHWEVVPILDPSPVFAQASRIAAWLLVGGMIWGIGATAITAIPPVSMLSS